MSDEHVILKPVPKMERVFVSSDGRVFRQFKGWTSQGRPMVSIRQNKQDLHGPVSRLVAVAFLGPCPPGLVVCHNDGDCTNNSPRNLRYDTQAGNIEDCRKHGTRLFGERVPSSKLKEAEVLALRRRRSEDGLSYTQLAHEFGVCQATAFNIVKRKTWTHI